MPDMEYDAALRNGLRPDSRMHRNAQFLGALQGLIPTEFGLKQLPSFTYPLSSPTLSPAWPNPVFVRCGRKLLLCLATAIYEVNESSWGSPSAETVYNAADPSGAPTTISGGGGLWTGCGFHDQYFLTNGQTLAYKMASNPSSRLLRAEGALTVKAVASHSGRLVFGGLGGTWFSDSKWAHVWDAWRENSPDHVVINDGESLASGGGAAWIMYSPPGGGDNDIPFHAMLCALGFPNATAYTKFLPFIDGQIEEGQMGLYPCRFNTVIYAMREHNGDLIVYGDRSVSRLTMTEVSVNGRARAGYVEQVLLDHGIPGRGAINGDEHEHVFVTTQGEVWRLRAGEGLQRLGYDEYVGALTLSNLVVAFDAQERFWWFSDGTNGYCHTRTGLGGCDDIMPLSVVRSAGNDGAIWTGIAATPVTGAVVETNQFDGNMRQAWQVDYVDISTTDTDATGWQLAMKYRLDKGDAFTTKATETFDGRGRLRTKTPGIDFIVRLIAADRTKVDLEHLAIQAGRGKMSLRDLYNA